MNLPNRMRNAARRIRTLWAMADQPAEATAVTAAGPDISNVKSDVEALYHLLYEAVHDLQASLPLATRQTEDAFADQWEHLPTGRFLLSDNDFRKNITDILTKEEILLAPEWFKGKRVLDAGCGNGRWAYGLAKLGVDLTCADVNPVAIASTKNALAKIDVPKRFVITELEAIGEKLAGEKFDLVFSWGVVHHCRSFNESLRNICSLVADGGVIFMYLYGRESMTIDADVALFKERVKYNMLPTMEAKHSFLLEKAHGDLNEVHVQHDIYSPLINRRLDYEYVEKFLKEEGFSSVERVKEHTEIWVRGVKGDDDSLIADHILPKPSAPYWFQK